MIGISTILFMLVMMIAGSDASKFLRANDVILAYNSRKTNNLDDLLEARKLAIGTKTEVVIFPNQKETTKWVELKSEK